MTQMGWASDAIAELLRALEFEYAALVPGSSYRGLHDSFVNYLGDEAKPKMLVCLHEEHTVAIAHGYAKVTGKPMLAVVHSNVGLMHAAMAVYDAWCDRVPLVLLGATGPVDATKRRPWIDWIHTMRDQASMTRPYTKWDDQPGSLPAALDSIVRATQVSRTAPCGPTYVVLDVAMQEEKLAAPPRFPALERFRPPQPAVPSAADVRRALEILRAAKRPVMLVGRVSRSVAGWNERVALAEALEMRVITDIKLGAGFPTDHPLHVAPPGNRLHPDAAKALREADAILNLDSIDLAGMLSQAYGDAKIEATIVSCSLDRYLHNGASMDHQANPPVDLDLVVQPEILVSALLDVLGRPPVAAPSTNGKKAVAPAPPATPPGTLMGVRQFTGALNAALAGRDVSLIRVPLGANGADFTFHHPLDYLGGDGGGGVGAGPGLAVGAALGLRGTGRLPVAVLGDGDYLMGLTAIWTAVANQIPLLVVVANNRSYYNDIAHQERVAIERGRPVERKWIGQRIDDPPPDLAMLARGQGAIGIGPVSGAQETVAALQQAAREVEAGKVVVVDVLVTPEYAADVVGGEGASIHKR
jgi:thiamine pyrophosphate-dependent acetolactate synthase large subunit-like protein